MFSLIVRGGPVMIPLCMCSLLSLAFILERLWALHRTPTTVKTAALSSESSRALKNGGLEEAKSLCNRTKGVVAYIFIMAMQRYDALMHESRTIGEIRDELILAAEEAGRSFLERFLPALSILAGVSTLLGLLGTITGMIKSFDAIAKHGATGDPQTVAKGVSEALITTAAGLIIAIPTIVGHGYLKHRAQKILSSLERYYHGFVNSLIVEVGRFISYKETLRMSLADGILDDGERELLRQKRVLLNITTEKADQIEREVKEELNL